MPRYVNSLSLSYRIFMFFLWFIATGVNMSNALPIQTTGKQSLGIQYTWKDAHLFALFTFFSLCHNFTIDSFHTFSHIP